MRYTNKSDLVKRLEALVPSSVDLPHIDVKLIDGAQLVQKLDPKTSLVKLGTFSDYVTNVICPRLLKELESVRVWMSYGTHTYPRA